MRFTHLSLAALAMVVATIAVALVAQAQGGDWTPTTGLPFSQPTELRSSDGVLEARITIGSGAVPVSGDDVVAKTYDGSFVGPTLRVKPGDTMRLTFVNTLDVPTNVHFHGLHVSPRRSGDNVFVHIPPNGSRAYRIRLPRKHNIGSFWYHSHQHGRAEAQVFDGLSGMIIVDGLLDRLPGGGSDVPEYLFALKDLQVRGDKIESSNINSDAATNRTVNGNVEPVLDAGPAGQAQLWHIANIGADIFYNVDLRQVEAVILAEDGNPVTTSPPPVTCGGPPGGIDCLVLPPGKRFDLLVRGSPGAATIRTLRYDQGGDQYPQTDLVSVRFDAPRGEPSALPARLLPGPRQRTSRLPRGRDRRFVFSEKDKQNKFFINGFQFPNGPPVRATVNTVERWTLLNRTHEEHPFHLHQYDFRVLTINGKRYDAHGDQDTVILPAINRADGTPGRVVIRVPLTDFPGRTVFHCHILNHEDNGMMKTLVVESRERRRG